MASRRGIHLVGSLGLEDAETVFRTLAHTIGPRAKRYPDGDTGVRGYWLRWQQAVLAEHPLFERVDPDHVPPGDTDQALGWIYRLREGVTGRDVIFGSLGYAAAAIDSYEIFDGLRARDIIPPQTRFQVSLPTPVGVISSFIACDDRVQVEPAYERAMRGEIETIAAAIPSHNLAIQWDVCREVVGAEGGCDLYYEPVLEESVSRLARLAGHVPAEAELGFHLCYGDPLHAGTVEPQDTATAVAFANAICKAVPRPVNWVHLPVPRDRHDSAFFAPLDRLRLHAETELFLGLVHLTDGAEGARRRIAAAENYVHDFGIATECGFGGRDPATIRDLLRLHAAIADG